MTAYTKYDIVRHDMQTIAFYNLENLFNLVDDTLSNDPDLLPRSPKKWTHRRYQNKLRKLGFAIGNIGKKETGKHPAIVGLAEVENASVIEDLIASKPLEDCNYSYVHYNSPDERGMDVALLYDTTSFEVLESETFTIDLSNESGCPEYTRDILLVTGTLDAELIHVVINHWSSRREGIKETETKRLASSRKLRAIITAIQLKFENAKIVVLGDFNDGPHNTSIKQLVKDLNLYNPMETLQSYHRGSVFHFGRWNLFDQILCTTNFFNWSKKGFEFHKAEIFDEDFLKLIKGPFRGTPFRTFVGKKYKGGYSDHFPVYAIFKKSDKLTGLNEVI
ncbi:endonuclease [Aestuariivivens sediminis]|uniref:endonuclease/exonuclease/phosphatase family protein n=1 Tax=Aestuariivivens sediminis TaxID=2913557 RepID=UPI001F58B6EF|nr:endonuclease [Aestuariivivens sediminis]